MSLVFDAGGLIALERGERASWVRLKRAHTQGSMPITNAAVLLGSRVGEHRGPGGR